MSRLPFPTRTGQASRRALLYAFYTAGAVGSPALSQISSDPQNSDDPKMKLPENNDEPRMPDGKSQKNAIAKQQHEEALKDADRLVAAAEDLRNQLREAGTFVVPLTSVRKTEEIEKLARRIRGRLRY